MRFGIIGDVHGEHIFLKQALDLLKKRGASKLLCVGDIVDKMPGGFEADINICCELLQEYGALTVRGNHERMVLGHPGLCDITDPDKLKPATVSFLRALPKMLRFETPLGDLLLCHGYHEDDTLRFWPDEKEEIMAQAEAMEKLSADTTLRFVANGHSHMRMARRFRHFTIVNAGTLVPIHDPCFVELDTGAKTVTFFDFKDGGIVEAAPLPLP